MVTQVKGIYRHGWIELIEPPDDWVEGTSVVVTFVESNEMSLEAQGMTQEEAARLQGSLASFAEEWESPEMSIYDNYDAAKTNG
ncbi:hypothetical protein [Roseofilum capinflatum]|jgi:hypothetical protein|uniref:Uncharacterized protein n=1 Tax=Roseofilum capinflatum BLCC-M114 TaxID=3022440 RepID=A0ABT7BAZ5_9CYAN|nr:hypothetical protein [Roseofilum capinflatum]MDJ1176270.1 hypothetical protein [Roseofilum capinflatum BLCC-M114]